MLRAKSPVVHTTVLYSHRLCIVVRLNCLPHFAEIWFINIQFLARFWTIGISINIEKTSFTSTSLAICIYDTYYNMHCLMY